MGFKILRETVVSMLPLRNRSPKSYGTPQTVNPANPNTPNALISQPLIPQTLNPNTVNPKLDKPLSGACREFADFEVCARRI